MDRRSSRAPLIGAGHIHIVGAGLSGLAAAVRLTHAGVPVRVYEGAGVAGGRCRSFFDDRLERLLDNGNHLLMSGNRTALAYLDAIGARETLVGPPEPAFPFFDLESGESWTLRPNSGLVPWWILSPRRRLPGTRARDYLRALALLRAPAESTVSEILDSGRPLFHRLWEPLTVAALNAPAGEAAARLLRPVLVETFGRGGSACRPLIARDGLGPSFIEPALLFLAREGYPVALRHRLRRLVSDGRTVKALAFGDATIALEPGDLVILAVPPDAAAALVPGLVTPEGSHAILGAHYRLDASATLPGGSPFLGMVGGLGQWLFLRGDVASVTVSAADDLANETNAQIAERLWRDVARVLGREASPVPPWRIVKEKRATFAETPASLSRRPGPETGFANLLLAGDWTDTGLPATIEGAIRSGQAAARLAMLKMKSASRRRPALGRG